MDCLGVPEKPAQTIAAISYHPIMVVSTGVIPVTLDTRKILQITFLAPKQKQLKPSRQCTWNILLKGGNTIGSLLAISTLAMKMLVAFQWS